MNGETVAILESRLGTQVAELIAKRGGKPLHAPALTEVPDVHPEQISDLLRDWRSMPVKAAVFQTGVGTRALFKATDDLDLTPTLLTLLAATTVVARGPKPTGALRGRGVRIDVEVPDPYTTVEILRELQALDLKAQRVVVQRYGATNTELERGLQQRGATVIEIPTYRWSMPQDTAPLEALLAALSQHTVASVVFTSASQADNLFSFAQGRTADLSAELNTTLVASVGPVCSAALKRHGVRVDVEASPPKLGPLIEAVDKALSDGRR